MGRTLPWKPNPVGHPSTTKPPTILHPTATASPPPGTPLSRPKPAAPSARPTFVSGPVPPRSPARSPAHSRTDGSASSPPSSPFRPPEAPLPESFMTEGFDNDDRWRMVEDEFYSVAARFTAHLHAAQYHRLKDEAKRQTPTIQTPPRPVTRPPTLDVVRRQAASTLAASQRLAVATAKLHSKASDSAALPGDGVSHSFQIQPSRKRTHLASLLDSPRKRAQPLTTVVASSGKGHAVAMSTSSVPSSLGRSCASTPSARATTLAAHQRISMSALKTAHNRDGLRGTPERVAVGGLTPERARSQSHHDINVRIHRTMSCSTSEAGHLTAATATRPAAERHISARDASPQKPMSTSHHATRTPTPYSAEVSDGSDSGSETYFQLRLRARRSKPKSQRGARHPALDEASGEEQSHLESKCEDTSGAALSIPSI